MALTFYSNYSLRACHDECLTNFIIYHCLCRQLWMKDTTAFVCSPAQEVGCAQPKYLEFHYNKTNNYCHCPVACQEILYYTAFTQASFTESYLSKLASRYGQNVNYWRTNAVELKVFYEDLVEEIVTHQPVYSVLTLLCNMGGALGLILGTSVLVVFEILDFFLFRIIWPNKQTQ